MTYKILVLDIDGTLTNSEKKISEKTKKALLSIQERGHKIVLASGRPTSGILPFAKELEMDKYGGYILAFNGAKIIDCKSEEIIYQNVLPKDMISSIYYAAIEEKVGILTYYDTYVITGTKIDSYMKKEEEVNHMVLKQVDSFPDFITFDIHKCLLTGEPEHMIGVEIRMKERLGRQLTIYRSEPYFVEIMPKGIDKAYSLEKLLNYLGLSKEQMISCGDGYNDLTMIQYAGKGVAMGNAQKEVKEVADYITFTNNEDGVAHIIKEFIL